jgi:Protein of unknown function (DUF4236)
MGWRFRRSIRLAPGVRWNFGKRSTSLTVGPRGFKTTIGTAGTRRTIGLPGTGLSYTTTSRKRNHTRIASTQPPVVRPARVDPARFGIKTSPFRVALWCVTVFCALAGMAVPGFWLGVLAGIVVLTVTPSAARLARRELDRRIALFKNEMSKGPVDDVAAIGRLLQRRTELGLSESEVASELELLNRRRIELQAQTAG